MDGTMTVSMGTGISHIYPKSWVAENATNPEVLVEGVNHAVVYEHDGEFTICQISGYTPERGLFHECFGC